MHRCSGNFLKVSKKHPWWNHFWIRETEIFLKEGLYHRRSLILGNFWKWMSFDRLILTYFNFSPKQFLSNVSFCNVTRNVNKKFLQLALVEHTPYRKKHTREFLMRILLIIYNVYPSRINNTGLTTND